MLLMSEYLVPLPPGHIGAKATSSVALRTVGFIVTFIAASAALPVSEAFMVRVSLRLTMLPAVVSSTEEALLEEMVAKDFVVD